MIYEKTFCIKKAQPGMPGAPMEQALSAADGGREGFEVCSKPWYSDTKGRIT